MKKGPQSQEIESLLSNPQNYKRVLLKISGEALACPSSDKKKSFGISSEMLKKITCDIKAVHALRIEIGLVIGGGNIYRGAEGASCYKMNRSTADHMGMLATVINGLALQNAIEEEGLECRLMSAIPIQTITEPYIHKRAVHHMRKGRIVLFVAGCGNPFFTTDTAAALRANEMNCDLLLKATKVEGVYNTDPEKNPKAQFLPHLTYGDILNQGLKIMDATAIILMKESQIPIAVFSIYEDNGFLKTIQGQGKFTLIKG